MHRSDENDLDFILSLDNMKSFSHDLSPINAKNRDTARFAQEMRERLEGEHSDGSHLADSMLSGGHLLEQRIATAARTIVYLFSPDIDLLENFEHGIENYDKYKKTRLILRELVAHSVSTSHLQQEIMRTSEEVFKLQAEIDGLSMAFQQLTIENTRKDEEIVKYRQMIGELSRAYEEAKTCFSEQLLQRKYEIEELRGTIERMQVKNKSRSKSKSKKVVLLEVPQEKKRKEKKEIEAYTDLSIYKRFTTANALEESQLEKSFKDEQSLQGSHITYSLHHHVVQTYEFEKQKMDRRINEQKGKIAKLQQQIGLARREKEGEITLLRSKVESLEAQLKAKTLKLKQKNKTIGELLDSLQAKSNQKH